MPVYVDPLFDTPRSAKWRYDQACHMRADTLEELHEMADRIGHRRSWFQGDHYDLTASRRVLAVKFGAIELGSREFAEKFWEQHCAYKRYLR